MLLESCSTGAHVRCSGFNKGARFLHVSQATHTLSSSCGTVVTFNYCLTQNLHVHCWRTLRNMLYSRIRLRCNGWNKGDILKIFVRPGGGGRTNCCDLAIGLAGKAPPSSASPSYGLLWADSAIVDGGVERTGSWRAEDVSQPQSRTTSIGVPINVSSYQSNP